MRMLPPRSTRSAGITPCVASIRRGGAALKKIVSAAAHDAADVAVSNPATA